MKRNQLETILGAIVLIVAGFFVITAYQSSGVARVEGYKVSAAFSKIDGINIGSDVRIGGIKVGTVTGQYLDPQSYKAILVMNIKEGVKLPTDSSAEIASESLLGGKYVNLTPGADEELLKENGKIEYTQSSINLEQLIGKFAFGSAEDKKKEEGK